MEKKANKPTLVFFQWKHDGLPKFLQLHTALHVKCLSESFHVILINEDCDYQQICDMYQPDLCLFESGYKSNISRKPIIKNTSAYPQIPKLGFHNGDSWCDCRVGFISDMAHWGIETFFSICTTTAEHTRELSENLFVWPNFIDGDVYRDYGQPKSIPVLFNGLVNTLYPWRQKINRIVSNCYPSLIFPHLGYESHSPVMFHGEQYARTINASWFSPACGTLAKEIVRKHFEIPGSKSCLVTEKTPSVEAAGFIDMQNCVFADERDILDKLDYLFRKPDELQQIINEGYTLVHARHTLKQRDQIFQWFNLYRNRKSGEKIVQLSPFEPLKVVEKSSGITNTPIVCNGLHLVLFRDGDQKLWAGKYQEAEGLYLKCLNYIPWMSEPKLKLAICYLYKGDVENALNWIKHPIQSNLGLYSRAFDSDPVEWAYFIICLLCQGNLNEAIIRASQFPTLYHPELVRTRWIIDYLQNKAGKFPAPESHPSKHRYSIHQLPHVSLVDWINNLCTMLKNCQQDRYAEIIGRLVSLTEETSEKPQKVPEQTVTLLKKHLLRIRIAWIHKLNDLFEVLDVPNRRKGLPSINLQDYIVRLAKWTKIESTKKTILNPLRNLKGNGSSNNWSNEQNGNEFSQAIQYFLAKEEIKTVIIIGTSIDLLGTKEIFTNKQRILDQPLVFFINTEPSEIQDNRGQHYSFQYYEVRPGTAVSLPSAIASCVRTIKQKNSISRFDLALINSLQLKELEELQEPTFIILKEVNTLKNYQNKQNIISNSRYTLVDQNPLDGGGYAVFRKANTPASLYSQL